MIFILLLIIAFILGSIPSGLIIGKYWLKLDIREHGSGNIGMTNVVRIGGKWPGIITFILDFFKGMVAVLLARYILDVDSDNWGIIQLNTIGIVAVCGHVFSIFLKFKGGKGISTTFGVLAALNIQIGLVAGLIWIGTFAVKRISSLSALTMLVSLPFLFLIIPWLLNDPIYISQFFLFFGLSAILIYRHRENISRLLAGSEGKLKAPEKP